MPRIRGDKYWETWSEEDFKFVDGLVTSAQEELAVASCRSLDSEVRDRATRVELLLRAASMMMQPDWKDHGGYIKNKIEVALGVYGMEIIYRQYPLSGFIVEDE